jgi:hypothetical protein
MRIYIKSFILICCIAMTSCESIVEDINDNPNQITADGVEAKLFLTGAMLANSIAQCGHLNRISGMYSGQLVGYTSLYSNIYGYSLSSAESVTTWSRIYVGTLANVRTIRETAPDNRLLGGIAKALEANAIGTAASLFGDIPYTEAYNPEISDATFDNQLDVLNDVIALLNDAITDFGAASSQSLSEDIYFEGNKDKWTAATYTLIARYQMLLKNYSAAYAAAQNGISSSDGSMLYIPRGDANRSDGDKNLFWMILAGSRAGDIGSEGSYLSQLLDPASDVYRGNDKTDETARSAYYAISSEVASDNRGVIEQFEPQPIVTFEENTLILAEAGARTQNLAVGLGHLNDHRAYLRAGGRLNANFIDQPFTYEEYVEADFQAGGIENADGIDPTRALLREIVEERYVSGFGSWMPFDDARRLRKEDSDLIVPFPLNPAPSNITSHPERMPYSADEVNTNENAPEDPGIFTKTRVNQ